MVFAVFNNTVNAAYLAQVTIMLRHVKNEMTGVQYARIGSRTAQLECYERTLARLYRLHRLTRSNATSPLKND